MYEVEERETLIRTDELMECWLIETTQRTMCTKIRKLKGVEILSEEITENGNAIAGQYKLPMTCVSFRNLRVLSEEQRQKASDRAKKNFGVK